MLKLKLAKTTIYEIVYGDPQQYFEQYYHYDHSVLLTGKGQKDISRYSFIGVFPHTIISFEDEYKIRRQDQVFVSKNDFWKMQEQILSASEYHEQEYPACLCGGIGYLAYDALHQIEQVSAAVNNYEMPAYKMVFYNRYYVFDHWNNVAWQVEFDYAVPSYIATSEQFVEDFKVRNIHAECDKESYIEKVEKIRNYIFNGDVYEVNLSQQIKGEFIGNHYRLFQELYSINPAPFSAYMNFGSEKIICNSPEMFLQADGNLVQTRPIKGTIARSDNAEIDLANRNALQNSAKDQAELFMIIDLLRNDLGKVCRYGSMKVEVEKRLEKYQNVYHLVGIVSGIIREESSYIDLWKATFPGGSISGCPKVRSMEIIHELESYNRHLYTGSIFIMNQKYLNSNIVIRSGIVIEDQVFFNSGGAITIDSDPASEFEETEIKLRSLMQAVGKSGDNS